MGIPQNRIGACHARHPRLAAEKPAAPVRRDAARRGRARSSSMPAQANYLGNVMRLKEGDQLLLFDGASGEWLARSRRRGQEADDAGGRSNRTRPQESVPDLWLAFAPVKKGRVDWLVEKAVELGVARLQPVVTQRTIVDKLNLERMRAHRHRGGRAMRPDRAGRNRRAGEARRLPQEPRCDAHAVLRRRERRRAGAQAPSRPARR